MSTATTSIRITAPGSRFRKVLGHIKNIPSARFDGEAKTWAVPTEIFDGNLRLQPLLRDGEIEVTDN